MNTLNIRDWKGTHPVSGHMVVGSVVILTESNNINFETSQSQSKNTTSKSEYHTTKDIKGEEF